VKSSTTDGEDVLDCAETSAAGISQAAARTKAAPLKL